jgi:2-methylcitrate dehydratase PrpD
MPSASPRSLCGGLLEFARGDGGMAKRLHLRRASEADVLAASLAADGFEAPRTVLEGEFGFLKIFCTKWDEAELTRGLGEEFVVSSTVLKRYPCHASAHAAVRACVICRPSTGLRAPRSRRSPSPARSA